jgi:hypothetical protein
MCDLIVSVVMNVLGKIGVQYFQFRSVDGTPVSARNFFILDSTKLVVLNPKITFENLGCGSKPE